MACAQEIPDTKAEVGLAALLAFGIERLDGRSDSPRLDAELLLAHVLERPRSHLRAWPERPVAVLQQRRFHELIARRAVGEPVAYLIGHREFWSLKLAVNAHTLVPRPETECLVELALGLIPKDEPWRLADIGTGSGAIALALASERPRSCVIATDISPPALGVARANAENLGIKNVEFCVGDGLAPLRGASLDMICSNPPYLAEDDPHLAEGDLPAEPRKALVGGKDGLEIIERLAHEALHSLRSGGWLLLEHGWQQGGAVAARLRALHYQDVTTVCDYAGHPRVTFGRRD